VGLVALVYAIPTLASLTWPSIHDDIEDIVYLSTGYNARGFAASLESCTALYEPNLLVAAGMIRTAFHDFAAFDVSTGLHGLDASVGFELDANIYPTNTGDTFNKTLQLYSTFFSSHTSMADLIGIGVYAATRACGGPKLPIQAGRIDATGPGPFAVPQPTDSLPKMIGGFQRANFSVDEMVWAVGCGHTLGKVHSSEHPDLVPTSVGAQGMDSTDTHFDNKIFTEFLDGTTQDPLVVGANPRAQSDRAIYSLNNSAFATAMADPVNFPDLCSRAFVKMVNSVPSGVVLSEDITPYEVKPTNLQLSVAADGVTLDFTGELRILTSALTSQVASVTLVYFDRTGASNTTSTISATLVGTAQGLDDTFAVSHATHISIPLLLIPPCSSTASLPRSQL
jgi:hypothetical protein